MVRVTFILLLWVGAAGMLRGQNIRQSNTPYFLEHLSQEKGLSQGTAYAIAQYDGFMWFATQDGLNRFDGYGFNVFRPGGKRSLTNSIVLSLLADSKGRFWVGTGGGLNLYDKTNEQFDKIGDFLGRSHMLDSVSVEKLIEDKRGNIWAMTDERGLFRIDPRTRQTTTYLANDNTLYGFCLSPEGKLFLSTYQAVYQYDESADTFRAIVSQQQLGTQSILGSIVFDKTGNLWIGTRKDGLFRMQPPFSKPVVRHYQQGAGNQSIVSNEIMDLLRNHRGEIWIGTRTGGLSIYNPDTQTFSATAHDPANPRSLAQNSIWSLYEDQRGIVWIGFSSHGVDKYDPNRLQFHLLQRDANNPAGSLPDNMIFRLFGQNNDLFIGTSTGGMAKYNLLTGNVTPLLSVQQNPGRSPIVSNEVRTIIGDTDQTVWLANGSGLIHYDPVRQTYQAYTSTTENRQLFVYGAYLAADTLGRLREIWTGGGDGLSRFDLATKTWKSWQDIPALKAVATYPIRVMYPDKRQNLWLGTLSHGLLRYDLKTRSVTTFDQRNGLNCANIRSILHDNSDLWVGTDCGLFRLDLRTYRVTKHYTASDSAGAFRLPNNVIYGILKDNQGYLWLSSNKGLTRFSPSAGIVRNYDRNDGLQSDEFNTNVAYRHSDGTLFFGGVNGINFFKPEAVRRNTFIPPVRITSVTVLDSTYNPNQKQLVLPYNQNFIDLVFTALNFSNTDKNQYRYQLEGIDPDWIDAQYRHYANYTNLPPGEYVFRVKASNDDGVWNEQGTAVTIVIEPPFWGTWWFRMLLILLLVGGMYGIYRYRIYALQNRQAHELSVSIRTQELERQRFAKELHDGVGANLSVLKMYLSSLGNPNVSVDDLKARSLSVLKTSIDDIRSIIHDMHPRSLSEAGLVQTIREMVALVNESHQLGVTFESQNVPQELPSVIEINLFRVVQELLQNAIKHSKASSVWLTLRYENATLALTYRDNGQGFEPALAQRVSGNGLVNIQQRIALLKGTTQFTSSADAGTSVMISVPV
ncbi:two-component regulator propeller domain-containing protein [Spirosoma sp.]|uniref:sensor histidine kinase n=1 Tax=Spirosoma sp. TaxID=1899569 RepID=UPI003B3A293D